MNQETINSKLKTEIARECMIKEATKNAQLSHVHRQCTARRKIEILHEQKVLSDEFILNSEVLQ